MNIIEVLGKYLKESDISVAELADRGALPAILQAIEALRIGIDLSKCTRVEVIDERGRSYVNWKSRNKVTLSMQDNSRTLKIFIKN